MPPGHLKPGGETSNCCVQRRSCTVSGSYQIINRCRRHGKEGEAVVHSALANQGPTRAHCMLHAALWATSLVDQYTVAICKASAPADSGQIHGMLLELDQLPVHGEGGATAALLLLCLGLQHCHQGPSAGLLQSLCFKPPYCIDQQLIRRSECRFRRR